MSRKSKSGSSNSSSRQAVSLKLQHDKVMQQAIQKASCLIQLLTRQNSQCKNLIQNLNQKLQQIQQKNKSLQQQINQLSTNLEQKQYEMMKILQQNQQLMFQLQKFKLKFSQRIVSTKQLDNKTSKNKQLHEKIATLVTKNIQIQKKLSQINVQYLSLQNQNQYLLKQLNKQKKQLSLLNLKHEQKQNILQNNIQVRQNNYKNQLCSLDRTKQAFARRTQQMKQQKHFLFLEIDQLTQQCNMLRQFNQQNINKIKEVQEFKLFQQKICNIFDKINIKNNMNIKLSTKNMMDQIQMFVNYRFQHIQTLIKSIYDRLDKPQWKDNIRIMNQTQLHIQRLSSYISQLYHSKAKQ